MGDIFDALNHLNRQMQGGGVNIIEAEENLKAFQKKLPLWKRRTENDNFANFPLLDDCVSKIEDVSTIGDISVPGELKQAITMHLDELAKSLDGYFPTRVISSMDNQPPVIVWKNVDQKKSETQQLSNPKQVLAQSLALISSDDCVSRVAVDTVGTMCSHLKNIMDPELEAMATALLQKVGIANEFI
ncbi:hypothetical protein AAFF_G00069270 [Aldrovandia affinis]|uniref:Uncharacterized protein n=1 Tax=Aldrovandia affinis TaxID=143900 RepID=A0AAD7RZ52_9TELE|nr:hypothetical protein AAFF_G00069270 [Aldrovandia affinis]